ncbi:hypothetical protein DU506_01350 [Vreelandella rituensis]|uniref:Uncharacterized protein n=2 Tax=Vreelandella rituensis TaxID=2282306 RepID=A0A368UA37_9GAMM|nr:hypothetical protein DU506_01350 [Halomonas rituensis]
MDMTIANRIQASNQTREQRDKTMESDKTKTEYRTHTLAYAEFPQSEEDRERDYDPDTHTWQLGPVSTMPRSVRDYAEARGKKMPEGLYLFFGNSARYHVEQEMEYLYAKPEPATGYDLRFNITLPRKGLQRTSARSLIWKSPDDINAMYLGVGRTSKSTNDLLRMYTGDRYCIDRLKVEPWRINEYTQILEMQYGPLKAVVFDAMTATGNSVPLMRVFNPSIIESMGPLGVYSSLHDPNPPKLALPSRDWKGWAPTAKIKSEDRDLVRQFIALPEKDHEPRHDMLKARTKQMVQEGRIKPNPEMDDVVEDRLKSERHLTTEA